MSDSSNHAEMPQHYVYIVKCADNSFYTGYTNDLLTRIATHNAKKGAKYTQGRTPVTLIYHEIYPTKQSAMQREYAIKKLTRAQKERLILSEKNRS